MSYKHLMLVKTMSLLFRMAFGYLLIQMFINAFRTGGWDFPVYHHTALHLLHGEPIYDLARDQASGYKYPPWIAPFFIPLALFSENTAATIWQLLQVFSACSIFWWIKGKSRHALALPLSGVLYYGIFHLNILAGQIQLPLLALALLGFSRIQKKQTFGFALLFFSLSTKLFNLFSLIGLPKGSIRDRTVLNTALAAGALGIPCLSGYTGFNPLIAMNAYFEVATSKTGNLQGAHQGLPGFFDWVWAALGMELPVWPGICASIFIAYTLFRILRPRIQRPEHLYAVALSLGAAIHPLAFSYTFTWTYPLGAFAIEHAFFSGRKSTRLRALTVVGLFLLLIVKSGLLLDRGINIPIAGARGLGTLVLVWVLGRERETPSPTS